MSCTRASKFLEANKIKVVEEVSASQKLQAADARKMAKAASKVIVAKGKKVTEFAAGASTNKALVDAMLGPTGNLRAPTLRRGKTLLVGFNDEVYESVLG